MIAPEESSPLPPAKPPRDPFWGYTDVLMFVGLAMPCALLSVGAVRAFVWLLHFRTSNRTWELLPEQAVLYALLMGLLAAIFRLQYERPFWPSLGWVTYRLAPFQPVVLGVLTAILVNLVGLLIRVPNTENPMTQLLKDPASMVLIAVFGVTIGPLCEELVFRGFLQPLLVRSLGVFGGILAASIPFGLLHYQQYGNSWKHVVVITLAGAAFGCMRQATGSTRASTLMHAAYNALFFLALFGAKAGGRP
ncbi:MAG TPA: type II CAAX endopeptidase family protein [Candidatus Acidoferrales bacterium]|nr:type II CAAX endopeptidase family protein [Candidatus Acidoferrales bacterium]